MRICDQCGWHNNEPLTDDDLWCAHCQNFLGFPEQPKIHERRVVVDIPTPQTSVAPGSEAVLNAVVRNRGDIVEKVRFAIEGSPAGWTAVEPDEVGLFPDQEAEIHIVFRPPRVSTTSCGATPFRLVAVSESDTEVSDHAEGTVDVGAFVDVRASLSPVQSSGPSGGEHRLALENASNNPTSIVVTASQPGDDLALTVKADRVELAAGAAGEVRIDVVPREVLYSASERTHLFSIHVAASGQPPTTIEAQHVQEAVSTLPTLVLAEDRLWAAPGAEATATLTIRNRGRGGDDYALELLGPAAPWGRVTPPVVALPSAGEVTAKITFIPPRTPAALASEIPFGVRCVSQSDSRRSVVAEAVLTVEAVADIDFEIGPRHVRSRWSSRHVMDIENMGNDTADLRPIVVDDNHELSFAVSPARLQIPAGARETVLVKARTRHPKLVRKPSHHSFSVSLAGAHVDQIGFERIALLPRKLTFLAIFLAVVGNLVGAALLAFGGQINQWF